MVRARKPLPWRRTVPLALAPVVVALVATTAVGLAALRASDALGDGAVAMAEAVACAPRIEEATGPSTEPADPVDYETVVLRVMGEAWGGLSGGQRVELRLLLAEVVRLGVRNARAQPPDVRVTWVREATPRGERIVDVLTEGSSLTRNYHAQIVKMLRDPTKGYALLVERLRRKIERSS